MENQRGFFGIIIPKEILEDTALNVTEKFIYGYIASFTRCCFESNETIAKKLGLSESTVKHTIPKLVAKGYFFVEKKNNNKAARRIYSVLDNPKKLAYLAKKGMFKNDNEVVENSARDVQNMHYESEGDVQNMHFHVQNMHYEKTGVRSAKYAHIDKEEKKNKVKDEQKPNTKIEQDGSAGLAGEGPASGPSPWLLKRADFGNEDEYEDEFYKRNTICLSAIKN